MKNLLLATVVGLLTTSAMAASTGTLLISGTVSAINDITLSTTSYTTLNITGGETNRLVATATELSNNLLGYKINMRSLNGSKLVHGVDASKSTAYTVSYDGQAPVSLTTSDQPVRNTALPNSPTGKVSNIAVNVTAYPTAPAGTYSDTITISIVAN